MEGLLDCKYMNITETHTKKEYGHVLPSELMLKSLE